MVSPVVLAVSAEGMASLSTQQRVVREAEVCLTTFLARHEVTAVAVAVVATRKVRIMQCRPVLMAVEMDVILDLQAIHLV
jgi:hypothetical protein